MIQIMSHDQRYETQYLWGIKLSLFSPSARKNINLHYIITIMIKTSSSHRHIESLCIIHSTVNIHTAVYCIIYYIQTICCIGGTLQWHWQLFLKSAEESQVYLLIPHTLVPSAVIWQKLMHCCVVSWIQAHTHQHIQRCREGILQQ